MEEISAAEKFKLKKFLQELEKHRGRHTELISVYVPQGYEIFKIIQHLAQEQGTATNIKSTSTRKNVVAGLERMIQHLKLFTQTPPNGLAAFAGNVAERPGDNDIKVWSIEPPAPLNIRIYRCDKEFVLEPLLEMLEAKEVYGMIIMDRREAALALLKGKSISLLVETHSAVPGKFKAGGQSAQRFARIREGAAIEFYKKVADYAKDQFLQLKNLKGILVGGPGPNKYEFTDGGYLTGDLQKKVITIKDISYTGEFGLNELLEKCQDVLAAEEVSKEKELVNRFLQKLGKEPNTVCYGKGETMRILKMGAVDIVLISEYCGDDAIEQFEEQAKLVGTKIEIISTETREGVQLRDIGGVAGILRYEVQQE